MSLSESTLASLWLWGQMEQTQGGRAPSAKHGLSGPTEWFVYINWLGLGAQVVCQSILGVSVKVLWMRSTFKSVDF